MSKKFFTNVLKKADIFNDFFSQQYQSVLNDSTLPLMPSNYTNNRSNDINFNYDKILNVV